jgi:tRNA pseudouridine55 synthase
MTATSSGLIVVDKPEGPTSFDVVARVRRLMGTREVGHCGTLDPFASGVLVVAVGSFTRLVRVLTADDKAYTATVAFGASTTTDDREGETVARGDPSTLTPELIAAALADMVGVQLQTPPAYSAVHVDGERAYARARRGEAVEMKPREVVIQSLALLSFDGARATLDVRCGKGTYVRSIARDLGARLGVPAHLGALRRTASGGYTLADAVPLDELSPASLMTGVGALRGVRLLEVDHDAARALAQGKRPATAERFAGTALAHRGGEPVALVRIEDGRIVVERGFSSADGTRARAG